MFCLVLVLNSTFSEDIQFIEEFSHASGAAKWQTDGKDTEDKDGVIHSQGYTYAAVPDGATGTLLFSMKEYDTIKGPDGKRGVLSFGILSRSNRTDYFGFAYIGSAATGPIDVPAWERGKTTTEILSRSYVSFKYKALNTINPKKTGIVMGFKLEPDIKDSWNHRADFGNVTAESEWQVFRRRISSASNAHAFLNCINQRKPAAFKFSWSHAAGIDRYDDGDELLVDDLEIRVLSPNRN